MKFKAIIFLLLLLLVYGCNHKPKEVLPEDEMVDLLTDLQLAEGYLNSAGPNSVERDALIASVLKKHGVSQAQLDSTIAYYGRNIDEYYLLYNKVENNIRKKSFNASNVEVNPQADDIWPYNRFAALFPNQTSNGITFSFPADNLESGNTLEWKFRLPNSEQIDASFGVEYTNGLISLINRNSSNLRGVSIELQTDTSLVAKRIFGSMTSYELNHLLWVDSIQLVKLPFDSLNYYKIRSQKSIFPPQPKPKETPTEEPTDSI